MQVEYCDLSMVIWSTEILARRCGYRKLIVPFRLKVSTKLDSLQHPSILLLLYKEMIKLF